TRTWAWRARGRTGPRGRGHATREALVAGRVGYRRSLLLADLADDAAGVAGREDAFGDVSRHHAAGADDRPGADPDPRAEDRRAADPAIRADLDRLAGLPAAAELGVHRVRRGVDLHRRAEQGEVPDPDPADVEHHAVEVEEDPLAQQDVRAVVAEERRLHPDAVAPRAAQGHQDPPALLLVRLARGIESPAEVARPASRRDELGVG